MPYCLGFLNKCKIIQQKTSINNGTTLTTTKFTTARKAIHAIKLTINYNRLKNSRSYSDFDGRLKLQSNL